MGKGLEIKSPVPSDIDIAQSCTPIHISQIAKQLDIAEDHYDLYGAQKAKAGHGAPPPGAVSPGCWMCSHGQSYLLQVKLDVLKSLADSPDGNYGAGGHASVPSGAVCCHAA